MKNKIILMLVICSIIFFLDQITKGLAVTHLKGQDVFNMFNVFFLTYHENPGAMLSLGADSSDTFRFFIFTVCVGIGLVIACAYVIYKPLDSFTYFVALLIIGGGFGNLYDRAFNDGLVVDFMLIKLGSIQTGVFNIADIAITTGVIALFIDSTSWGKKLTKRFNTCQ